MTASKTIGSYAGMSGEPDVHFIDHGRRQSPVREGRRFEIATTIHEYAMDHPERDLSLTVRSRCQCGLYIDALATVAADRRIALSRSDHGPRFDPRTDHGLQRVTWPNGTRLTVHCGP